MTAVPVLPANGANMPALGLGTWKLRGVECVDAVAKALALGYRHIDTAVMYGNEAEVGEALRAAAVPRGEVFLTTKVLADQTGEGNLQRSAGECLERLKFDSVDLLLLHWPNASIPLAQTIAALCDAQQRGMTRHIGVANFTSALLRDAVKLAGEHGARIACNQCEYHPRLDQSRLLGVCRDNGVAFVAYYPLAQGRYFDDAVLTRVAKAHSREVSQIMLRWLVQQPGVAAIPKSASPAHLAANFDIFGFALSPQEMADISAMARPGSRMISPGFGPVWDA